MLVYLFVQLLVHSGPVYGSGQIGEEEEERKEEEEK